MRRIRVTLIGFALLLAPLHVLAVSFDQEVLRATLQIQIYDNYLGQTVSSGTGIAFGMDVLTNYHVIKTALADPQRYIVLGCLTYALNTEPDCKHQLSLFPVPFGKSTDTKYDRLWDLALLHLDKVRVGNEWKSYMELPITEFGLSAVNISAYTTDYEALRTGDTVYSIGYPDYGNGKSVQVDGVVKGFVYARGQPLAVSDFAISYGNSGGPVFNSSGELVGVTVACVPDQHEKCIQGLFIPLPTLHWWYTDLTGAEIFTWEGKSSYSSIPGKTLSAALCMLRSNAHYDPSISTDSCTCNAGWSKSISGGDCDIKVGIEQAQAVPPQAQPPRWNNDLRCQAARGEHGVWTGTLGKDGSAICDCSDGYQYDGRICVPKSRDVDGEREPLARPVSEKLSQNPSQEPVSSVNVYDTTRTVSPATATATAPTKKRGFWSWLFGLFGR
ncbi:hypothetical protein COU18_03325 [Candidatus Kaiserbacteria bacterium CG10_big_fil_rev_8_21_14_0_10_51_14]|uniref:Peptidase S1 domain-containing protein n=1 Tax=Candidatus Kaiserbacteria bacterium CG10_big_fil_rev_8_21_14_0_10_51_14 TaxID=1974610 RepID=A0A2H0UB81_9BACT|nr:MAG: hypothetical protein COU18_03325 [Candidatus Kaiserbacteria bacterium CG10_big_fil_rev_8_21_14_0_10_51_14]